MQDTTQDHNMSNAPTSQDTNPAPSIIGSYAKRFWAGKTPEERSQIMKARQKKGRENRSSNKKTKKSQPKPSPDTDIYSYHPSPFCPYERIRLITRLGAVSTELLRQTYLNKGNMERSYSDTEVFHNVIREAISFISKG